MTKHRFRFGDVIRLEFPYVDKPEAKVRPVVVISSDAYHQHKPDVIRPLSKLIPAGCERRLACAPMLTYSRVRCASVLAKPRSRSAASEFRQRSIVAGITSNLSAVRQAGEFLIKDWKAAGLHHPSRCKAVMGTASASRIIAPMGHFSPGNAESLKNMLRLSFEL